MEKRIPKKAPQRRFVSEEEVLEAKLARKLAVGRPATGSKSAAQYTLGRGRLVQIYNALKAASRATLPDSAEALVVDAIGYLATRLGDAEAEPSKAQGRQGRTYCVTIGTEPETRGHTIASAAEALAISPNTLRQYLSYGGGIYTRKHPSATVSVESRQSPKES